MPLYLRPPRAGKTPNHESHGTHLGPKGPFRVETSSGAARRSDADSKFKRTLLSDLSGWAATGTSDRRKGPSHSLYINELIGNDPVSGKR
jgi:hypothetical protein